jgi:NADPH-dependent curcumin reductase CurA
MRTSRQYRLAARPVGEIKGSAWEVAEVPVSEPAEGEFDGDMTLISIDPVGDGRLTSVQDAAHGEITAFPGTLRRLFSGENTGKLVLELGRT